MPVDPQKTRILIIVHGVQTGTDADQNQHEAIRELIDDRLNGMHLDYQTTMFRYEDLNDEAQANWDRLIGVFAQDLLVKKALSLALDMVGDVVTSIANTSTAQHIRALLRKTIEDYFQAGNPVYLLGHSLGSIYCFDVVNELIQANGYFDRTSRKTWPVQGLMTIGSPIGLSLFSRTEVAPLGAGTKRLRWINYWSRSDPVVTGSAFGISNETYSIAEKFQSSSPLQGWHIQDKVVDNGRGWLFGHTAYWGHPGIGDDLITLLAN